jgi:hypothetical protein
LINRTIKLRDNYYTKATSASKLYGIDGEMAEKVVYIA